MKNLLSSPPLFSGVSAPAELTEILPADQEFAHLTKYLGLSSSPRLLLDSPFTLVLVRRWMSHPDLRYMNWDFLNFLKFVNFVFVLHQYCYTSLYTSQTGTGLWLHCSSPPADTSSSGMFTVLQQSCYIIFLTGLLQPDKLHIVFHMSKVHWRGEQNTQAILFGRGNFDNCQYFIWETC